MKKEIRLRSIDRYILGLLAALVAASGLYLVGPWYLEAEPNGSNPSPLFYLTNNLVIIRTIGAGMLVAAGGVFWSITREKRIVNSKILSSSLLAAFLLRLFTFFGTVLTLESWRPPGYLSAAFSILVAACYWVWVKVGDHEGITR